MFNRYGYSRTGFPKEHMQQSANGELRCYNLKIILDFLDKKKVFFNGSIETIILDIVVERGP